MILPSFAEYFCLSLSLLVGYVLQFLAFQCKYAIHMVLTVRVFLCKETDFKEMILSTFSS